MESFLIVENIDLSVSFLAPEGFSLLGSFGKSGRGHGVVGTPPWSASALSVVRSPRFLGFAGNGIVSACLRRFGRAQPLLSRAPPELFFHKMHQLA